MPKVRLEDHKQHLFDTNVVVLGVENKTLLVSPSETIVPLQLLIKGIRDVRLQVDSPELGVRYVGRSARLKRYGRN